ncbi:J domain-containing protein [Mycetohabitans sp. B46]|uniref:J domain-containing protein n=1 Tax=Mycetohabitans sp. B46 TaxID=2772536 RepID=UPI00307E9BD5
MKTLYDILGVTPHATPTELKAAWRRAAMKWHPDRNRGQEHYAQAQFQRINDAYAALTNPLHRVQYDLALHAGVRRIAPQPHGHHRRTSRWRWGKRMRLFLRNVRMAPHTRRAARDVSRWHWMAGIGTAIAAVVLIADLSIDDAPLRSNFVSTTGTAAATSEADPALEEMHTALAQLRALARTARDDTAPARHDRHPRANAEAATPPAIRCVTADTARILVACSATSQPAAETAATAIQRCPAIMRTRRSGIQP